MKWVCVPSHTYTYMNTHTWHTVHISIYINAYMHTIRHTHTHTHTDTGWLPCAARRSRYHAPSLFAAAHSFPNTPRIIANVACMYVFGHVYVCMCTCYYVYVSEYVANVACMHHFDHVYVQYMYVCVHVIMCMCANMFLTLPASVLWAVFM
jgi:hypothetical protein